MQLPSPPVCGAPNYAIDSMHASDIILLIDSLPLEVPTNTCGCGGGATDVVNQASGVGANPAAPFSAGAVRYFDATVKVGAADLFSGGFGVNWGQDRSWTNGYGYAANA